LHMTTSGDLGASARQFLITIGDVRQLPEKPPEKPAAAVAGTAPAPDAAFALRAEGEALSAADGTRVVVHRLAARQAALTLAADTLRQYVAGLPPELQGRIEASLGSLWASGELDLWAPVRSQRVTGSLTFAGLRVRVQDSPRVMMHVDELAGAVKIA